ncbi:MAG TPA: hypothetical protein VK002_10540 [Rubricoccaceae bacterium]|nr:hypothetical protein [Rubricoccaceae bacterium]
MRPLLFVLVLLTGAGCAGDGAESASPDPVQNPAPPIDEAPTEAPEPLSAPVDTTRADSADALLVR